MADDIITYNTAKGLFSGVRNILRLSAEIKKQQFDLAILFQNAFEAALITKPAGVKHRVGFSTDQRGFLLTLILFP